MWNNENLHSLLLGMQNGTNTLDNCLVVPQMVKHSYRMIQGIYTPRHMPRRNIN